MRGDRDVGDVGYVGGPDPGRLLGGRYQLLNEIGRGGMGRVYRALDRLTGRVVTLKRVVAPLELYDRTSREGRVLLAREFRLLASLRHPNIISVLDYGFDEGGEPYYTMDLAESARTIVEAGALAPLAVQVDLLVQTLRALMYLHRHGIIHRDIKPGNILVVGDQVKLLDFGLALRRDATTELREFAGTPLYMTPEMLRGEPASERSDLYALGMVALEMLLGRYPLDLSDGRALYGAILTEALPRQSDRVDARLRPTVAWLLAKDPAKRPNDPVEVIAALARAVALPLAVETPATRESLLQAAPFVGRTSELRTLVGALHCAKEGRGGAWLVSGESGVGKSRLLEEIRTAALVDGVTVAVGQVRNEGGSLYHAWQDILRTLVLRIDVTDAEASVLKAVLPTLDAILGRPVPDAPPLDPESAQSRLLFAVEAILERQPQPVLLTVEDLQWAGSGTLRLWRWLGRAAVDCRLMLVGTLRSDEAPHLIDDLSLANVLRLERLDQTESVQLAESMLGSGAGGSEVAAALAREAEGIPFFLVELIRTLAEQAGGLGAIQGDLLRHDISSDRMTRLMRRRVDRVPSHAIEVLQAAAVAGRSIDPRLMRALFPSLDVEEWAASCSAPAVLEFSNQEWRFAHDKLREQILLDLDSEQHRDWHRRVGEAIEATYPAHAGYLTALAHHWRDAGNREKEAWYAQRAGLFALESGACPEAITLLARALELLEPRVSAPMPSRQRRAGSPRDLLDPNAAIDPETIEFRLGMIEGALTEAYYRLGDLRGCREHAERALGLLGRRLPRRRAGWVADSVHQGIVRALQSIWRRPPVDPARTRHVAGVLGRIYVRLADTYIFRLEPLPMLWATLCFINHCEAAGPSPELALGYLIGALRAEAIPARRLSRSWSARALDVAERTGAPRDMAFVLSRISMIHMGACRWEEASEAIERATELSDSAHDLRLSIECRALAGALCEFTGQFERGAVVWQDAHRLSLASGNRQTEFWGLVGQADNWSRLGRYREALALFEASGEKMDEDAMRSEAVWRFGMLALARLRAGDPEGAHDAAMGALRHLRATAPVVYYMQTGTAATVEVLLALREAEREGLALRAPGLEQSSRDACARLRRFARPFALGRPHALLWSGSEAWLDGRAGRARRLWERALAEASARSMPYEEGSAHLEIGRHLPPGDPQRQRHLLDAVAVFERVGCVADARRARATLDQTR
jgi:tetratricopeptide (TPR) repeat protein